MEKHKPGCAGSITWQCTCELEERQYQEYNRAIALLRDYPEHTGDTDKFVEALDEWDDRRKKLLDGGDHETAEKPDSSEHAG